MKLIAILATLALASCAGTSLTFNPDGTFAVSGTVPVAVEPAK